MSKNAPTLHDVAKLAGVSYQTVSRVINGERYVAAETLERVQKAIDALNYRPNRAARSLITRESGAIQIIVFDIGSLFALRALLDTAQKHGYGTFLSVLRNRHSAEEVRWVIDESASRQMDGVLLMMPWVDMGLDALQRFAHQTPLVVIGADLGDATASVVINQRRGAELAVDHLLGLGHRRFGEITGSVSAYYDAQVRHQTTLEKIQTSGASLVSVDGDFSSASGYRAANQLMDTHPEITSILCANDQMAFGAMRALLDRGVRIPQDISVIGFDDHSLSAYNEPPLTTIRQDFHALGRLGMELLLEMVKTPAVEISKRVVEPELIARKSTGPARE